MIALKLELFNDDKRQHIRMLLLPLRGVPGALGRALRDHCDPKIPAPWVARITGIDTRFGLRREFLRGRHDYTHANGIGSRGIHLWYNLERNALYEINEQTSWHSWSRRFEFVDLSGKRHEWTREEAMSWANAVSE